MPSIQMPSKTYKIEKGKEIYQGRYKVINFTDSFNVLAISPKLYKFDKNKILYDVVDNELVADAQKREYIAKKYIFELMEEIKHKNVSVDFANEKIISFWKDYINDFSVDNEMDNLVSRHPLKENLSIKKQLFRDVIEDNHSKIRLLLDKELSPEALGIKSEETHILLKQMIKEIYDNSKGLNVAIIQSGQAYIVDYLKAKLNNLKHITLFDRSISMLNLSREKYGDDGFTYELYNDDFLKEEYINNYDHIIMINTIHQFEYPKEVIRYANIMLKKGGKLHLIDFTKMDAVSILVAIFFQVKYLDVENETRHMFFHKTDYLKNIVEKYFDSKKITTLKNNEAYYIVSVNTTGYVEAIKKIKEGLDSKINRVVVLAENSDIDNEELYFKDLKELILEEADEINNQQLFIEDGKMDVKSELEKIWKYNLEIDRLSDEANYFKLGGNSLSATKLVVEINKRLSCRVNLKEVFENPFFDELLVLIQKKQVNPDIIEGEI